MSSSAFERRVAKLREQVLKAQEKKATPKKRTTTSKPKAAESE